MLTKGDPCRVNESTLEKCHFVEVNGIPYHALSGFHLKHRPNGLGRSECRFVGNPCVPVPKEV